MTSLVSDTRRPVQRAAIEWPSMVLCAVIYGSWGLLIVFHAAIPIWAFIPIGAWISAWHSSFQHEVLHGHPTRWRWFNVALATPPMALWIPYERYRITHLTHHRDERLTDPYDDPETSYFAPDIWHGLHPALRLVFRINSTFVGRISIGPAVAMVRFFSGDARAIIAGDRAMLRIWLWHGVWVACLLGLAVGVAGVNLFLYLLTFMYLGTSLMLIRSYCEHRAEEAEHERTAIIENSAVFGVLFLNNNLHAEAKSGAWPDRLQ